ncbi:uncharacterized protein [Argopecten irradians]|uniref:uncharacterized protein n=1 Tax=Argopecten irradians TaxID=31199 RepID=UPI00371CA998
MQIQYGGTGRVPSFRIFPSESASTTRKRLRSTPTGKTPSQAEKRGNYELIEINKKKSTDSEKAALKCFVGENPIPSDGVNKHWNICASYINDNGGFKSGDACRILYNRTKSLNFETSQPQPPFIRRPVMCDVAVQTTPQHTFTTTQQTQTTPFLPIINVRNVEREWSYFSKAYDPQNDPMVTTALNLSCTRLPSFANITSEEKSGYIPYFITYLLNLVIVIQANFRP